MRASWPNRSTPEPLLSEATSSLARAEYSPGSSAGLHLLAHELAHVVQQGATGKVGVRIQRQNPASGGQAGFRLAPVAYDKAGQPLSGLLTPDEVAKLQALKDCRSEWKSNALFTG